MLSETLSGKCPCCSYNKLLQRYGSFGYFHVDGCPNCGFGYGSNQGGGDDIFGEEAFLDYGVHILTMNHVTNDSQEEYDKWKNELSALSNLEKRKMIFEWAEKQERCNDVENTVFKYSEEDVKKHLSTNPVIFKLQSTTEYLFDVDRKDLYCLDKQSDETMKKRLTVMAELGMEEVGVAEFGIKGVMSGLYIEMVWNYSEKEFDDYIEWVKNLKEEKLK